MDDRTSVEIQITSGEVYRQRIQGRFKYLDGLTKQPQKTFFIPGLVPSIFTSDLSEISRDTEESQRNYQRACGLFVGYLRDIYALLTGNSDTLKKAKEIGLIDITAESRLLGEATSIDEAVSSQEILDGTDIATGRDTAFFDILGNMKEQSVQFQQRVVTLGKNLNELSTSVLLGKPK